jgi:hypothetical protein
MVHPLRPRDRSPYTMDPEDPVPYDGDPARLTAPTIAVWSASGRLARLRRRRAAS